MDMEAIGIANKYAEQLFAGVTSGVVSHSVDEENNAITINFADGTTSTLTIATPQAKVDEAVNAYLIENPETEFLNIKKNGAIGDGVTDDSECFTRGVAGYVVNDGTYCVDASTMARLNGKNCIGNGYLKLLKPNLWGNDGTEKWYAPFDYVIAVKDLDNVLQKQMVSKGEANYFASLNRQNATAMLKPLGGECYAHTIGAVYKIQGAVLPDKFTACIGNLQLYLVGSDMLLKRIKVDRNLKKTNFGFFELPWVPEVSRKVTSDKYKICDDHTEFYFTASDFEGHADGKTESVLHFWGNNADLGNRDNIIGVIASFDFWVKEEEARDKLIVQIGVDQMDYNTKTIKQACSGNALKMETYPRTSWSTSMNRELLDLYVNPKQLDYLHSLPFDDTFGTHQVIKDTGEYEQKIVSMANGDMYLKLFDDAKNYRDLQVINPIKHMYLPYCSPKGSTGTYCKIFSIPIVTDSTQRYVFKVDVVRHSASKVLSHVSAILTIIRGGLATIDILAANTSDKGVITVVTTDANIDVYVKGMSWGYVVADIELLMYADIAMLQAIDYDTDLLRVGAGTRSIMFDKWTSIDTSNCTVVESDITSPLEHKVVTLCENGVGNTTKVINVMDNNIAKCVIDGMTDDYAALNEIKKYVNSTTEPITVLFPYTGNAMMLSDMIHFTRSNITLEVYCDITFTKSLFEEGENMTVFKFGRISDRTPISNINFIGHGITIDANGAALGVEQASHSQVAEGNGIRFQRILGGTIKGVHVTNALCDGILIYNSKNVIVEDCEVSVTVMDNGLTVMGLPLFSTDWQFDKYADRCRNNVIVRNCVAHNNEDLGFSASVCYGVTFENCFSYENGNADGFNAGGGYSAEGLNMSAYFEVTDMTYDMDITFSNCRALNNNNYAFYTDINGMTVDSCIVDKTIANDTTTSNGRNIRGGNGIFGNGIGRLDVLNTYISNTAMYAVCTNPNSNVTLRLEKLNVTDCAKGVYVPCVAFLYIKDLVCKNTKTPIYLNDGTKKKYVELKNISLYDCEGAYIGGAEYMDADNIYLRTADGVTVAMTLGNVDTGVLQNVKVYKGDNTKWLTGVYINDTTGTAFAVSENMLTDANTAISDKRATT